jgi:uncharacterized membrane protein
MHRLTLGGVPVHPALVHFPIVFWVLVPLMDVGYALDRGGPYWRLGWILAFAGVISALPAIVAGALDAFACRNVEAAESTLWRHAGLMLLAWTLFALACLFCSPEDPQQAYFFGGVMHGIGALTLIVGAHAGGQLAHVHHLPGACTESEAPRPTGN